MRLKSWKSLAIAAILLVLGFNKLRNAILSNSIDYLSSLEFLRELRLDLAGLDSDLTHYTCDHGTDCAELQHFLTKNWPANRPRAVIYLLTHRITLLKQFFELFDRNFNKQFDYPIVLFHEANFTQYKEDIRTNFTSSRVYFYEVSLRAPWFVDYIPEMAGINVCNATEGYRHMCRFHAKTAFDLPIMKNVDYYWRLDDDSEIVCPIDYDLFQFMQTNNYMYGYFKMNKDSQKCVVDLWNATWDYVTKAKVNPTYLQYWPDRTQFLNNFEISETRFWRSPQYKDYVNFLDRAKGFYTHRWGDAPIHSLGLALFANWSRVYHFKDIGYRHKHAFSVNPCGQRVKLEYLKEEREKQELYNRNFNRSEPNVLL